MFGYLPATFFAIMPLTVWLPQRGGLALFVVGNVLAATGTAWILYRWWFLGPTRAPESRINSRLFVWPLFLTVAHFQHVLQGNQLTIWVLFWCVSGLTLVMQRRETLGGMLVGMVGCLKVTPLIFVLFFALRRQWRAVSGMMLAVIVFDILPSCVFFGIDGAVREHANWLRRVEWYSNWRFIEDPWLRITRHGHEHNTSLAVVLARWLQSPPHGDRQVVLFGDPPVGKVEEIRTSLAPDEHLTIDPMPEGPEGWSIERNTFSDRSKIPRFHVGELTGNQTWAIWMFFEITVISGVAISTLIARREFPNSTSFAAQAALWLILMLWPSPMVRDYYLALAIPASVVAWRAVLENGSRGRLTRGARWALGAVLGSYLSVICLSWDLANWYGIHLLTLVMLSAAGAWAWWRATPLVPTIHGVSK
jgi:hypothetical protein